MACDLAAPEGYLDVLRAAFGKHYAERSDVWTPDAEMRAFPAFIHGRLKLPASARVLDLGCGAGRDVAYFARLYASVDGIDLHPHADWPAITGDHPNARFTCVDVLDHVAPHPYELIFDNGCFHHQHPDHYRRYLAAIAARLAPGGHYVLSTFKNPAIEQRIDDNGRLHRYFSDAELHRELRAVGFEPTLELDVWRERCHDYYRLTFC